MSEITNAQPVWGPAEFPQDGRLELSRKQLTVTTSCVKKSITPLTLKITAAIMPI